LGAPNSLGTGEFQLGEKWTLGPNCEISSRNTGYWGKYPKFPQGFPRKRLKEAKPGQGSNGNLDFGKTPGPKGAKAQASPASPPRFRSGTGSGSNLPRVPQPKKAPSGPSKKWQRSLSSWWLRKITF